MLLVDHAEVKGRVRMHEEIHCVDTQAAMHGCAVSSIAVRKNAGVAPDADLYFVAVGNMRLSPISIACRFIPGLAMATLIDYGPDPRAVDRIVALDTGHTVRVKHEKVVNSGEADREAQVRGPTA